MLIKNPLLKINMTTIGMFIMMVIFKVMIQKIQNWQIFVINFLIQVKTEQKCFMIILVKTSKKQKTFYMLNFLMNFKDKLKKNKRNKNKKFKQKFQMKMNIVMIMS